MKIWLRYSDDNFAINFQQINIARLANIVVCTLEVQGPILEGAVGEFVIDCILEREYLVTSACVTKGTHR